MTTMLYEEKVAALVESGIALDETEAVEMLEDMGEDDDDDR